MDIQKIKELIELMKQENIVEVEIEEGGKRIKLRKNEDGITTKAVPMPYLPDSGVSQQREAEAEKGFVYIKSPMIGTFYQTPSPDAPAYVDVGDEIQIGGTVCIIEAMKLMNEIKSEVKGKLVEVLVENGDPVDYGQVLFKIKTIQ